MIFLIFTVACVVESLTKNKENHKVDNKKQQSKVEEDVDIDSMLQRLERKTITKTTETTIEQKPEPKVEKVFKREESVVVAPVKEEPKHEEEEVDFDAIFTKLEQEFNATKEKEDEEKKRLEELKKEEERKAQEEQKRAEEAKKAEAKKAEEAKPVKSIQALFAQTNAEAEEVPAKEEKKELSQFDYQARYDALNDSLAKSQKELVKATKEVNKYEKTQKRKARNEMLLDKKAGELTNLNLVLYNVNDIKEIDPQKKEKQESLTQHITELKDIIKDADEYLATNKEKYKNAVKIQEFLTKEKARQEDELNELAILIEEAKKRDKK